MKKIILMIMTGLLITSISKAQSISGLEIYLLREISVDSDVPTLGQIAIIRGDSDLAEKARAVTMGRIATAGQKITMDKSIILSRLACSGIDASQVTLSGAETMTISRKHQIINGSDFIKAATEYLRANLPDKSICQYDPINSAQDLIIAGRKENIKFSCGLVSSGARSSGKVRVSAICDGNEVGLREIGFRFKYKVHKIVTQTDIAVGTIISTENIKIEEAISNIPEPADWTAPYGLIARHAIAANTELNYGMIETAKPEVLIKRDQNVVIKISRDGVLITANGKTLQDGSIGEAIKVQNADTQRIIIAKVCEDGTVEPIF
jgi:flagellar basal body P-ring formation protein FlgA